jgi:hypothetical protein
MCYVAGWCGGSACGFSSPQGQIRHFLFISCLPTVEGTGWAVRGERRFATGYGASGVAGHGGPLARPWREREGEKGVSPCGCISLFPLPNLAPNPLLKTLAASTGRRRYSPLGGGDPEGLEQLDLRWRVPGSMVTGSSSACLQVHLLTSPPSVCYLSLFLFSPPSLTSSRCCGSSLGQARGQAVHILQGTSS